MYIYITPSELGPGLLIQIQMRVAKLKGLLICIVFKLTFHTKMAPKRY